MKTDKAIRYKIAMAKSKGQVLTLVVEAKWFNMYMDNIKKEDYRAISNHWESRLLKHYNGSFANPEYKEFEFVDIRRGYTSTKAVFEFKCISIKTPNEDWSPAKFHGILHFAIEMGEMVYTETHTKITVNKRRFKTQN